MATRRALQPPTRSISLSACSSGSPDTAAAGAAQAAVWQQNAAAWAERLGRQYPLYRDVVQVRVRGSCPAGNGSGQQPRRVPAEPGLYACVLARGSSPCQSTAVPAGLTPPLRPFVPRPFLPLQPIQLAVQELRYGLALLAGRAALASSRRGALLAPVLAHLMAFPRSAASAVAGGAATALLDSRDVQQAVGDAAAEAAEARLGAALASSDGSDAVEKARRAAHAAAMSARLRLLRCSLAVASQDLRAARLGAGSGAASAADVASAQARLHSIFLGE